VNNSTIANFANDTKISRNISSTSDASSLQEDLTNFQVCSSNVNLELNAEKCKILRITRKQKKIECPYKLHNNVLESKSLVVTDLAEERKIQNVLGYSPLYSFRALDQVD
jgi:hypothetical protein